MSFFSFKKNKNRLFSSKKKRFTGYNYNNSPRNDSQRNIRNTKSNKSNRDYRTQRYYEDGKNDLVKNIYVPHDEKELYGVKDCKLGSTVDNTKYFCGKYKDDVYDEFNNEKEFYVDSDDTVEAKSKFVNKYKIDTEKMNIPIDNLVEKIYPADIIHVKRRRVPAEEVIKKLVDVKNGKIVKVKKGKFSYQDIKKIVFFALSDIYYARHEEYRDLIIPMDPLCYDNLKNGGSFNIKGTFHPASMHDKNGDPVEPKTLKQKLARTILRNMRYMHPYPVLNAVAKPQKVYIYKTNIRWLNRKYLTQSFDTKKGKLIDVNDFKPVMDYVAKCSKAAITRKKDSIVALPIALSDKDQKQGHAVLFTCQYDRKANKFLIKLINTNGMSNGYELYAKPLFTAFKKLLPYYIDNECRLEARYSDLNNQVGGTCMQFSNKGGENVLKNVPVSQVNINQIIHGATIRAAEAQLCESLGVKISKSDAVVKDVSEEINALVDNDVNGFKKRLKKDFNKKQCSCSFNNIAKSGVNDYITHRKVISFK